MKTLQQIHDALLVYYDKPPTYVGIDNAGDALNLLGDALAEISEAEEEAPEGPSMLDTHGPTKSTLGLR